MFGSIRARPERQGARTHHVGLARTQLSERLLLSWSLGSVPFELVEGRRYLLTWNPQRCRVETAVLFRGTCFRLPEHYVQCLLIWGLHRMVLLAGGCQDDVSIWGPWHMTALFHQGCSYFGVGICSPDLKAPEPFCTFHGVDPKFTLFISSEPCTFKDARQRLRKEVVSERTRSSGIKWPFQAIVPERGSGRRSRTGPSLMRQGFTRTFRKRHKQVAWKRYWIQNHLRC